MLDRPYTEWPDVFVTAVGPRLLSSYHVSCSLRFPYLKCNPFVLRRNIHFNGEVEQCITLSIKGADNDTDNDQKTIAMLRPTTLKYVENITKPYETTTIYSNGFCNRSRSHPS